MKALDIVIPYKEDDGGYQLRYTLRSIAKNLPHRNIFICGDKPDWATNIIHLPHKTIYNSLSSIRYLNAEENLMVALEDPRLSDDFVFFNDDFFVTKPIDDISYYYLGFLPKQDTTSPYRQLWGKTGALLAERCIYQPKNYELHIPMVMNKFKRASINYFLRRDFERGQLALMRSVYGNLFNVGGTKVVDVKDKPQTDIPFMSTSIGGFKGGYGDYIRELFKEPCRYEADS